MAPLGSTSPAFDGGDPALLGTTDQRGYPRTGRVSIGAYQEYVPPTPHQPPHRPWPLL
jgi:hypothetical protein